MEENLLWDWIIKKKKKKPDFLTVQVAFQTFSIPLAKDKIHFMHLHQSVTKTLGDVSFQQEKEAEFISGRPTGVFLYLQGLYKDKI